jgi:ABC-type sugar transport system substrate-binding protein
MAEALQSKGQIGLVYHAADFFVTRQRYEAFKKTIAEDYPTTPSGPTGLGKYQQAQGSATWLSLPN